MGRARIFSNFATKVRVAGVAGVVGSVVRIRMIERMPALGVFMQVTSSPLMTRVELTNIDINALKTVAQDGPSVDSRFSHAAVMQQSLPYHFQTLHSFC